MDIKDYYTILELPPSASFDEIKKSYRRLAHIYHPDKKTDDPYAAARFTEIKEAYEVLTNPHKKDLYLQQRWYAQSIGRKRTEVIVTPETLLKRMLELDRYINTLDTHRMDKEGLYHYVLHILSIENIEKLNSFHEPDINREIIRCALKCGHLIPFTDLENYIDR
ncbi:MAG: DnaJ domain-containing protein, partial [Chitinophagaceae bacterium]